MGSYHDELVALGKLIGSDGCTAAAEIHQDCCLEHDWAYVTGTTPRGVPTTKAEADRRFRDCLVVHSSWRFLSPLAWWRWLAVHWFGRGQFPPHRLVSLAGPLETRHALASAAHRRWMITMSDSRHTQESSR